MKKYTILAVMGAALFFCCRDQACRAAGDQKFRNVIILIPDGCGISHMTIARWFKGAPLAQDSMDVSLVRTHSSNSLISGSAGSATAFSSGFKSMEFKRKAFCLGMRPDSLLVPESEALAPEDQWRPVATVLEGARLKGKATGLIATSRITHATPAAYASHWHFRFHENTIIEQMVYQGINVVFGGGYRNLIDRESLIPGDQHERERKDGENLSQVLKNQGYRVITSKQELESLGPDERKVWGMFAVNHMAHDIDRKELAKEEPSLAEMTGKAIDILSKNPEGFFLVVEGSQVDWASHNNDPVGLTTDYLAFDKAVKASLDFARTERGKGTLVLVFPDHSTGGMSLGRQSTDMFSHTLDKLLNPLRRASLTVEGVETLMEARIDRFNPDADSIRFIMREYYGMDSLTEGELEQIMAEFADTLKLDKDGKVKTDSYGNPISDPRRINLREVIGPLLSSHAGIGWTSNNHTGGDVPMFSYGLKKHPGTIDNTEIAQLCARAVGVNLDSLNARLIVEVHELFPQAEVVIDTLGMRQGMGSISVTQNGKKAEFPLHKNFAVVNGDTVGMEGLALYSYWSRKAYLPRMAGRVFE